MVDYIYAKIYETLRTLKVMRTDAEWTVNTNASYCRAVDVIDDIYDFLFAQHEKRKVDEPKS